MRPRLKVIELNGLTFIPVLKSLVADESWYVRFLHNHLYRSNSFGLSDLDVFENSQINARAEFLQELEAQKREGSLAEADYVFWKTRIEDPPSQEQVTHALKLEDPLLILDAVIREVTDKLPNQTNEAISKSIQKLTEQFGINQLANLLSYIPPDLMNFPESSISFHSTSVFNGVREVIGRFTQHGSDQFAGKHLQIQFIDKLRFDNCEVFQMTPEKWQISFSTTTPLRTSLIFSRTGWLLNQHWRLIMNLLEQNQVVQLFSGDAANDSSIPNNGSVNFAMCAHRQALHRVILVEDVYSANTRHLLTSMPEPLTKDAARVLFEHRTDLLFWRGSTTGPTDHGASSLIDRILSNNRVAFCLEAKLNSARIDAKITQVAQVPDDHMSLWQAQLQQWEIWGDRVDETEFFKYRYYIDLDGNSAAWGTIRKYLGLCLVIKPESEWKILHHDYLVDGVNFLSTSSSKVHDIEKALSQCDQDDLFEIAYRGHLTAHEYLRSMYTNSSARVSVGRNVWNFRK